MLLNKSKSIRNFSENAKYFDIFRLYCTSNNYNSYSDIFKNNYRNKEKKTL